MTKKAEEPARRGRGRGRRGKTFWILKKFVVFNADQVNGKAAEKFQVVETAGDVHPDYEPAEELIEKSGAEIHFGGDRSLLSRPRPWELGPITAMAITSKSRISRRFVNGSYYPTILHELGHWSEVRVGWDREKRRYAMGELIAEIASATLPRNLASPMASLSRTTRPI